MGGNITKPQLIFHYDSHTLHSTDRCWKGSNKRKNKNNPVARRLNVICKQGENQYVEAAASFLLSP